MYKSLSPSGCKYNYKLALFGIIIILFMYVSQVVIVISIIDPNNNFLNLNYWKVLLLSLLFSLLYPSNDFLRLLEAIIVTFVTFCLLQTNKTPVSKTITCHNMEFCQKSDNIFTIYFSSKNISLWGFELKYGIKHFSCHI